MIKIEITSDGKKVYTKCEVEFEGKRKEAIAEFVGAMQALKKSDKETFRDALHRIVNEDIHEMLNEFDELEDGGELDD